MAKLVLSSGGAVVFQCFIDDGRLAIGRDGANQIVIDDPAVSPAHAAVVAVGKDHILEDLGSTVGTYVNGMRVARHILQHGDVAAFGAFHLRYMNPRATTESDLDRTMLIAGLRTPADVPADDDASATSLRVPSARTAKTRFPKGRARIVHGPRTRTILELNRVIAAFGRPGDALAVIARRPQGFFLLHVEGRRPPRVNGRPIGDGPWQLRDGDVVEVGNERLEFVAG